jgi:hypothetical protein
MLLNESVFGHTNFKVTDKRLFKDNNRLLFHLNENTVSFKNPVTTPLAKLTPSTTSGWVSKMMWVTHYGCGGSNPPCTSSFCDLCNQCSYTTLEYVTYFVDDNDPQGGNGGGGYTNSGGGGSSTPVMWVPGQPIPCNPNPLIENGYLPCPSGNTSGWMPWVPVYQPTSNDIRVINQLNAEDAATDNILSNSDCQGTLRTGNINFNGTIQHWLIQLDYIAKHPTDGEREYAIPNSSPSGNRGYADLVNKTSREIFEIKPDNAQGKIDGEAEVDRYVKKANQFCRNTLGPLPPEAPWLKGNNYTKTILPSINPTQYLVADKIAPGVIGYSYESKANNPSPLPVVVPSTVLDKLKNLVERLKNNLADADRIIAEYMAEHPELVTYLKAASIGAAVGIVVGTIIEDFFTLGAGTLDDWPCFVLAYRIVRFAWAL